MKRRLSRKKIRAMIALVGAGLTLFFVGYICQAGWLFWIGLAAIFAGLCFVQPCPHCGRHPRYIPQWSERGKYYCSYCGERLSYDDEEE